MPNRIIRESGRWSQSLAALSSDAERSWWRLNTVFDDFGRYYGSVDALYSAAYPVPARGITLGEFRRSLDELAAVDCIRFFDFAGKRYVYVPAWLKHQQCRSKKSKFPQPPDRDENICTHPRSDAPVVVDGDVYGDGGGDVVGMPPAPEFSEPEAKERCSGCWELLGLLAAVPVYFAHPTEPELRVIHEAHETAGQPRAVAAVRGQIEQHRAGKIIKRFLSPEVLFKRKNWQVTVNAVHDRPPVERAERV